MPDYIINRIEIKGSDAVVKEIREKISGGENEYGRVIPIDFEKIVVPPKEMFRESITPELRPELQGKGIPNWSDWCPEHWGTKWNAHDQVEESANAFLFLTAWSPPIPIGKKLSEMFPEEEFILEWCEEDGFMEAECGRSIFKNGVEQKFEIDPESTEASELAEELIMKHYNLK